MGKLSYFVMTVRVKMLLFLRNTSYKKHIRREKDIAAASVSGDKNIRYLKLPGAPSEYQIHISKEHITNFLN